jgi:selenium-binding protein 1
MAKIDTDASGGMRLDPKLFLEMEKFRPHQVHLEGGDASSDSYCFS